VIVCPRCSKENQDHYKFCLGCGSELPREAAKKDFVPPVRTDPPAPAPESLRERNLQFAATQQGDAAAVGLMSTTPKAPAAPEPVAAPEPLPPAAAPRPAPIPSSPATSAAHRSCSACGNPVPVDFKFCGTCGHRMEGVAPAPAEPPAPAPAAPAPQPAATKAERGRLVLINPDGSEGAAHALPDGSSSVGRASGALFAGDAYLSPEHATFRFERDSCMVRDDNSLNGVYLKIGRDQPVRLNNGDLFRIGQEIVRFEEIPKSPPLDGVEVMGSPDPGFLGRLALVIGRASTGNAYTIPPDGMHIGRERGDVTFPEDGYVSGLHCRVHHDGTGVVLTDVGSSNGTFRRIRGECEVASGELLLLGQQLFRLEY